MTDNFEKILICGTNWLGDSIISMPAVQLFKSQYPSVKISVLVKPALKEIWEMHNCIDEVITFEPDNNGTFAIASLLKKKNFDAAYIFPNSFRSALIPLLARIKVRRGMIGKWRSMMLTDVVIEAGVDNRHQVYEYVNILDVACATDMPVPELSVSSSVLESVKSKVKFDEGARYAAVIPGAARGASKRWPDDYFSEVGRFLIDKGMKLLVLGSGGERELCQSVADSCGGAFNFAGQTSLSEFAGVLSLCDITVCNDSGGMHLAAAVGSDVVAVFGLTDPAKTGPLGMKSSVVAAEGVEVSRDIPRSSERAAECLRSIKPERVIEAIVKSSQFAVSS